MVAVAVACVPLVAAACGGSTRPPHKARPASVTRIVPLPAGTIGAGLVQANGTVWVLAGSSTSRILSQVDLSDAKVVTTVPVSGDVSAVAQSVQGTLVDGTSSGSAGAVEWRDPTTGAVVRTVPVGGPVRALAFSAGGSTLDVLEGSGTVVSLAVLEAASGAQSTVVGMPPSAVAVAPVPHQPLVWSVQASKSVQQTSIAANRALQNFAIDLPGIAVATSPDGATLYVLKGTGTVDNIAVVDTRSGLVTKVLPAAAGSVALSVSTDGLTLYDTVGTPSIGNIQLIPIPTR